MTKGLPVDMERDFSPRLLSCMAFLSVRTPRERCHACWGRRACACEAGTDVACVNGIHMTPAARRTLRGRVNRSLVDRVADAERRARMARQGVA